MFAVESDRIRIQNKSTHVISFAASVFFLNFGCRPRTFSDNSNAQVASGCGLEKKCDQELSLSPSTKSTARESSSNTYDLSSVPLPLVPGSVVPRVNSGSSGWLSTWRGNITNVLTAGPTVSCGNVGDIESRVEDCRAKNPTSSEYRDTAPNTYWWQLVVRTSDEKMIWRDALTGLIWSDVIATPAQANWCQASGSNNKPGSPWAEKDVKNYCNQSKFQNQNNPVSLCAEDFEYLSGSRSSVSAKGGLGILPGATFPVTWWLPTIDELVTAYKHRADNFLPRFTIYGWLSSSVVPADRSLAWQLSSRSRVEGLNRGELRKGSYQGAVRCVASPVAPKPTWLVPRVKQTPMPLPILRDDSGLAQTEPPSVTCGTSGSIGERILDCQNKNPGSSQYKDSSGSKYWWQLVTRTSGGKIIWSDKLSGLIWSDVVSAQQNWCRSSGSSNSPGSRWAQNNTGPCSTPVPKPKPMANGEGGIDEIVSSSQVQSIPSSLCFEDLGVFIGTTTSSPAKGGLGLLRGATTPVTWWLPSAEELRTAYARGAARILPGFATQSSWSSTAWKKDGVDDIKAAYLEPISGIFRSGFASSGESGVRCVAQATSERPQQPVLGVSRSSMTAWDMEQMGWNSRLPEYDGRLKVDSSPSVVCGTSGSVDVRVADCRAKNPSTSEYRDVSTSKYWWQLVTKTKEGKILWRDQLTELVWSDIISPGVNWCLASGNNGKIGSPLAERSAPACTNPDSQSQTAPVSLCAEDPVNLNGSLNTDPSKGGLGNLGGATTPLTWWLPSIDDLIEAYRHGAGQLLPNFNGSVWWSSTARIDPANGAQHAFAFAGAALPQIPYAPMTFPSPITPPTKGAVRCVGK